MCVRRPEAIIDGVVKGLGVLQEKRDKMAKNVAAIDTAEEGGENNDKKSEC